MAKPHLLQNLILNEISLVDNGANPGAQVLFFKRDSSEDFLMPDDIKKGLNPEQLKAFEKFETLQAEHDKLVAKVDDFEKSSTKLTEERDFLKVELQKASDRLKELEKAAAENDDGTKKVAKVELPEAVQKQIDDQVKANEDLTKRLEKMETDKLTGVYVAKADLLKNLSQDPKEFGPILMRVSLNVATPEDVVALEKVLTAANEGMEKLLTASGTVIPVNLDSAIAKLEANAAELRKADSGLTVEAAFAKATQNSPELYTQYLAERQ